MNLNSAYNAVAATIESILGSNSKPQVPNENHFKGRTSGQTCLEKIGIAMRNEALSKNEWRKDIEYTKALVESEYDIQTEFEIK